MTFARWFLILNGLAFLLYGGYCIYNPQLVADLTVMTASTKALTEIRAMYGGLQFALGAFFIAMARQPSRIETAMIAAAACFVGLSSTRLTGILISGGDDYNTPAAVYEGVMAALAIVGVIRLRKVAG